MIPSEPIACRDVRAETAGTAELSVRAREHLATCVDCALALADHVDRARPVEPDQPAAPAAVPPAVSALVLPLAREDRARMGGLAAGGFPSGSWLFRLSVLMLGLLLLFGFPGQPPVPEVEDSIWRTFDQEFSEELARVTRVESGRQLAEKLRALMSPAEGPSGKDARRISLRTLRRLYVPNELPGLAALALASHAELVRSGPDPRAARALLYLIFAFAPDPSWPNVEPSVPLEVLVQQLFREGARDVSGPAAELVHAGVGLRLRAVHGPERRALCLRAIELRWELLRAHGPRAHGLPPVFEQFCELHEGHSVPILTGQTTALVASLAAARLRHGWSEGLPSAVAQFLDRRWAAASFVWLCRSILPGLFLSGCALGLWLILLAFSYRASLRDGPSLTPDRGARLSIALGAILGLGVPFAIVYGGLAWHVAQSWVYDGMMPGSVSTYPDTYHQLFDELLGVIYDGELPFQPAGLALFLAVALAGFGAAAATRLQQAFQRRVNPDEAPGWSSALAPLTAVLLLTWQPSLWGGAGVAEPVILGIVLLAALPWLRHNAMERERRLAALTVGTCSMLVLANGMAWLFSVGAPSVPAQAAVAGAMVVGLVWVPGLAGYVCGHLPPGRWRQARLVALSAVGIWPTFFGGIALRVWLVSGLDRTDLSAALTALVLVAILGSAVSAFLLALRSVPSGAGAVQHGSPSTWRVVRACAECLDSPAALAMGLLVAYLIGHMGMLALHLNLI